VYKGNITENAEYPTPIVKVEATDADDSTNYGAIRYSLKGPQSHLFTIDELTGLIRVAPGAILDREKDSEHTISIVASDTPSNGPFQLRTTSQLVIKVLDENEYDNFTTTAVAV